MNLHETILVIIYTVIELSISRVIYYNKFYTKNKLIWLVKMH